MNGGSKTLGALKRLAFLLPLLALPVAPMVGKGGAELLIHAVLHEDGAH